MSEVCGSDFTLILYPIIYSLLCIDDFFSFINRRSPFVISTTLSWSHGAMEPGANLCFSLNLPRRLKDPEPDSVTCAQQRKRVETDRAGEKERSFGFSMSISAPRPLRKCCNGESCLCDYASVQRMPNPDNESCLLLCCCSGRCSLCLLLVA